MTATTFPAILKVLVPLVTGILLADSFGIALSFTVLLVLFSGLLITFYLRNQAIPLFNFLFSIILFAFFLSTGILLHRQSDWEKKENYFAHYLHQAESDILLLQLADVPVESGNWIKVEAYVVQVNDTLSSGKIQLFIARDTASENLKYGDILVCQGNPMEIGRPKNPHEFDYQNYMRHQRIYHQLFLKDHSWKYKGNEANPVLEKIYALRNYCLGTFEKSPMQAESISVAKALILGDKSYISDELMLSYASAGALHILAVSGLHVGIVMLILGFVLSPLKRLSHGKLIFLICSLFGIWLFALITGLSPSVLRAAVMFSFLVIGQEIQRDTSIYQSLMVSAVILIVFDPHIIFQVGFLLSYFAVIGIVFFYPKFYQLLYVKNKFLDKTWQIVCVSLAAQIATFPLGIYCFQQFPNYFLLTNLIVIPLAFAILIGGILALFTSSVPFLSDWIFRLLDLLIRLLNSGVQTVENIPGSVSDALSLRWYDVLLLYGVIIHLSHTLLNRKKQSVLLTMLLFSIFIFTRFYNRIQDSKTEKIVFYAMKDVVLADIFSGENFISISNSAITETDQKIKFHAEPNRVFTAYKKTPDQEHHSIHSEIYQYRNLNAVFINDQNLDSIYSDSFPKTDLLYLYNCNFLSSEIIEHLQQNNTLVLAGTGCSFRLKSYLKSKLSPSCYHDLSAQGAVTLNFSNTN